MAIVAAKSDVIRSGFGQCIAAMYAAQLSNERQNVASLVVYGVVSTSTAWRYLRIDGSIVQMDEWEYQIDNLPRIMGILKYIVGEV